MNLCCQINPGFVCEKCEDEFCVDCWILVNRGFFKLEGGCKEVKSWCIGWSGNNEDSKRHKVKDLSEEASIEFAKEWRDVMEVERDKGNYFWEGL